ncbi:MAG: S-layer homology domain-containing protein [Defluviitaleaceae bacterium]|nr:S-layer homology domain-containing protein [Defluviitaleaceae bacterium]
MKNIKLSRFTKKVNALFLSFIMAMALLTAFGSTSALAQSWTNQVPTVTARLVNHGSRLEIILMPPSGYTIFSVDATISALQQGEFSITSGIMGSDVAGIPTMLTIDGLTGRTGVHVLELDILYNHGRYRTRYTEVIFLNTHTMDVQLNVMNINFFNVTPFGVTVFANFNQWVFDNDLEWGFAFYTSNDITGNPVMTVMADLQGGGISAHAHIDHLTRGESFHVFAFYESWQNGVPRTYFLNHAVFNHGAGEAVFNWQATPANVGGMISANANVTTVGTHPVAEIGFVYSNVNPIPTLTLDGVPTSGNFKHVAGQSNMAAPFSINATWAPNFGNNTSATSFWVRPYVIHANGSISHGEVRQVHNITPFMGSVQIVESLVMGLSAFVRIQANNILAGDIIDWGIAYSTTNRNPVRAGQSFASAPTNTGATSYTVTMDNLMPNTTYFVRAYFLPRGSNTYIYSPMVEVRTGIGADVAIMPPTAVASNSAVLQGSLAMPGGGMPASIGFVLSDTNNMPTSEDRVVTLPQVRTGNFSVIADGLFAGTQYWVRAFARFGTGSNEVVYSAPTTFNTAANSARITVSFRNAQGQELGQQVINTTVGSTLNVAHLNFPTGMRLLQDTWSLTVRGNEFVTLNVIQGQQPGWQQPGSGVQPPPPPGGQGQIAPVTERAFMTGIGNRNFGPDLPGTHLDVATMLFNLLADPNVNYTFNAHIPDVDYSNARQVNIVNFVLSNRLMGLTPEGYFQTNVPITRANVALVITEVMDLVTKYARYGTGHTIDGVTQNFPSAFGDTNTHWARGVIWLATQEGILAGFPDGTFRPNEAVTRAQLAVIFNRMFERSQLPLGNQEFNDVPLNHWARPAILNSAIPH